MVYRYNSIHLVPHRESRMLMAAQGNCQINKSVVNQKLPTASIHARLPTFAL
jgi:hypothetical protein